MTETLFLSHDSPLSWTHSTFSGKLCGFCGNYDGDSSNDNLKSDGMMTHDEEELRLSWQVEEDEDKE
jgi:hypothetical protein